MTEAKTLALLGREHCARRCQCQEKTATSHGQGTHANTKYSQVIYVCAWTLPSVQDRPDMNLGVEFVSREALHRPTWSSIEAPPARITRARFPATTSSKYGELLSLKIKIPQ